MLRRFNEFGVDEFRSQIEQVRAGQRRSLSEQLLVSDDYVETLDNAVRLPDGFESRKDIAVKLGDVVEAIGGRSLASDIGLWAWLSGRYIRCLAGAAPSEPLRLGAAYRYVPSTSWKHFYRHLLLGPVRIRWIFGNELEDADIVLYQAPHKPGEWVEQLSSRQELIQSVGLIGAATEVFFDRETGRAKRGKAIKEHAPGTLRRFLDVINQLQLTYDLNGMSKQHILQALPDEFIS